VIVFGVTDTLAHNFWHYLEPRHPASRTPQAAEYREALFRGYELCDDMLGRLMEQAGPECHTLVMSDHGFGTVRPRQLLFEFLIREGYLRLEGSGGAVSGIVSWLMGLYNKNATLRRLVRELRPGQKKRVARALAQTGVTPTNENVDWSRSQVVPSNFGLHLYCNRGDRFPEGLVSPGEELARLKKQLRADLLALRDPDTGGPVVAEVFDAESVYGPDAAPGAPDLVLQYVSLYDPEAPFSGPTADAVEGGHTSEGIFLAAGPGVQSGAVRGATLADLAPTALHVAGLPVPSDLDGRVLTEVLDPSWLDANPIQTGSPAGVEAAEDIDGYSAEEADQVEEQLRALGYL
jgi:predicted AlkP superfamily phosphohydrolase/phosphomutase